MIKMFKKSVAALAVVGVMSSSAVAADADGFTRRSVTGVVVQNDKHWELQESDGKKYFITKRMRVKLKDYLNKRITMKGLFKPNPKDESKEMLVGGKKIEVAPKADNQQ